MNVITFVTFMLVTVSLSTGQESNNTAWDCFEDASKAMVFNDATINPAPIIYPGNVTINGHIEITRDIPVQDFYVRTEIIRLYPKPLKIPCMKGKGSCEYDVCNDMLPNHHDQFCQFGFCECPVKVGKYSGKGITYTLPQIGGPVFKKLLKGDYTGKVTFYNRQSEIIYGSMCMNFTIALEDEI